MATEQDDGDITFEEQLALERQAQASEAGQSSERVKVDPDGTVYDWDADKKAWFPRINEDFLAQYHMNYGTDTATAGGKEGGEEGKSASNQVDFTSIPPMPAAEDPGYADWYYQYAAVTSTQEYRDWYEYYYGGSSDQDDTGSNPDSTATTNVPIVSNPDDERYWEQLTQQAAADKEAGIELPANDSISESVESDKNKKKKEKKVKPPPKPASWFDMEEENNTNVYISGLPPSITMDGFKELANKCGLIAFDPITKKPKLKLYKDADGNPKGDGLICYIKQESIELALKFLDGDMLDGHTLTVEKAKFELKGSYDPKKRKRKLTNKEKKRFREKQAKLFEWRPDKPRFARSRHEKTVVVKHVFSPSDVDKNPLLVNELEEDMRTECAKYGQVKKVRVHERHMEGAVSVMFAEAEEADLCKQALNGRWFACRKLSVETWDGKTKYDIEETEAQYQERLRKWQLYLETGAGADSHNPKQESATSATTAASNSGGADSHHTKQESATSAATAASNSGGADSHNSKQETTTGAETAKSGDADGQVESSKSSDNEKHIQSASNGQSESATTVQSKDSEKMDVDKEETPNT